MHITPFLMESCVSARWAQQFWPDIQGLYEIDEVECFLFLLGCRIMDISGRMGSFSHL